MRLTYLFLFAAALCLTAVSSPTAQTEPVQILINPVENDETPLVRDQQFPEISFDFTPLNRFGLPVQNLTPAGITLREDDTLINDFQLQSFIEAEKEVSILVLVDMGAATGTAIEELRAAVINLYSILGPVDNSGLFLAGIRENGSGVVMGQTAVELDSSREIGFTNDEGALINLINAQPFDENTGSPLYDAVVKAVRYTAVQAENERRAILLISDGVDTNRDRTGTGSNFATAETTITEAQQLGVPIFTIGWGSQIETGYLQQLAAVTGADYVQATNTDTPAQFLAAVLEQLKTNYRLTYRSITISDDSPHNITIALTGEDAETILPFHAFHPLTPQVRTLTVIMPNAVGLVDLSSQAEVTGQVQLNPEIVSRRDIRAVNYYLDGNQVATAAALAPPWTFEWDTTTLAPDQSHQLVVEVIDTADPPNVGHYETTVFVAACSFLCRSEQTLGFNPAILILLTAGLGMILIAGAVIGGVLFLRRKGTTASAPTPAPSPGNFPAAYNKTELLFKPFDELAFLIDLTDGQEYRLLEITSIGSDSQNTIRLVGRNISPQHAKIQWQQGHFDLNAQFKTKINSREIRQHRLKNGDMIEIGRQRFIFKHL